MLIEEPYVPVQDAPVMMQVVQTERGGQKARPDPDLRELRDPELSTPSPVTLSPRVLAIVYRGFLLSESKAGD